MFDAMALSPVFSFEDSAQLPNEPEGSNLAFKVRSIQKSHGWNRFWSRTLEVKDETLCSLFSSEKCGNCGESSNENTGLRAIASNIQRKCFVVNVRRNFHALTHLYRT